MVEHAKAIGQRVNLAVDPDLGRRGVVVDGDDHHRARPASTAQTEGVQRRVGQTKRAVDHANVRCLFFWTPCEGAAVVVHVRPAGVQTEMVGHVGGRP